MLIVGQDKELIAKLKRDLSMSFDMKDLGPGQQIQGMKNEQKESCGYLKRSTLNVY